MRHVVTRGFVVFALFTKMAIALTPADTPRSEETGELNPERFAYVSPIEVAAPLGSFVLVKRGHDICAIRFTNYHREQKGVASDSQRLFAEYDWFYIGSDKKFKGGRGHEKLSNLGSVSILGFHSFLPGKREIACGSTRLSWIYPIGVGYMGGAGVFLKDVQIAITPWRELPGNYLDKMEEVSWFPFDDKRRRRYFRLDEQPSSKD